MNPYTFILVMFIIAGFGVTVWGAMVMARSRRSLGWPKAEGVIEVSDAAGGADDLLPRIEYSYTVGAQRYRRHIEFPSDLTPTPEFGRSYVARYPTGAQVQVFYDPESPEKATLEPGMGHGDWMILAIGIGATLLGAALLLGGI